MAATVAANAVSGSRGASWSWRAMASRTRASTVRGSGRTTAARVALYPADAVSRVFTGPASVVAAAGAGRLEDSSLDRARTGRTRTVRTGPGPILSVVCLHSCEL